MILNSLCSSWHFSTHQPAQAVLCVDAILPKWARSVRQYNAQEYVELLCSHKGELKAQKP